MTLRLSEAAPPRSSLTTRFTAYLPGAAKVWLVVAPVAVVPSGKVHLYDAMVPSLSVDDVASRFAVRP